MKVVDEITFCGQPVAAEQLALIIECVARYQTLSREELAATRLCEWIEWRRPNGRLKTRECRDLLHYLQARSVIDLPALRAGRARGAATAIPHTPQGDTDEPLTCALSEVQPITLRRVVQPAQQRRWRELVGRYHYLGYATAYGASVRYCIETAGDQPTTLDCLQFSLAAWRMKARDSWIAPHVNNSYPG